MYVIKRIVLSKQSREWRKFAQFGHPDEDGPSNETTFFAQKREWAFN
jgi:hypothetical protein